MDLFANSSNEKGIARRFGFHALCVALAIACASGTLQAQTDAHDDLMAALNELDQAANAGIYRQKQAAYDRALLRFNRAMVPRYVLREHARKAFNIILMRNGHPENKRRALRTLERDMAKLSGSAFNDYMFFVESVAELIRAGRPVEEAKHQIKEWVSQDPTLDFVSEPFLDMISEVYNIVKETAEHTRMERLKKFDKIMGRSAKVWKGVSVITATTGDPLQSVALVKLDKLLDFIGELFPPNLYPAKSYISIQRTMLGSILEDVPEIQAGRARYNVTRLIRKGSDGVEIVSNLPSAWGIEHVNTLFGEIEPVPKLSVDKQNVVTGGKIQVSFIASDRYPSDAWIAMVPSHAPHGESSNEDHKISYQTRNGEYSGTRKFKAPAEPGSYEFRMHDEDTWRNTANEVAAISFNVVPGSEIRKTLRIFSNVASSPSERFKKNTDERFYIPPPHPFDRIPYHVHKPFSANVIRKPDERIILSGNTQGTGSWAVDNFLFIEVATEKDTKRFYVGGVRQVQYEGKTIPSLGRSGFNHGPFDLTHYIPADMNVRIAIYAMDFGGAGYVSELFMLFKSAEE